VETQRSDFESSNGQILSGRLELPDREPTSFALFAHCFTCGKDNRASSHLARALARARVAVLRFDFTGLGGSDGEFGKAGFTSNIGDLVAAADALRRQHAAPRLLIGHSLGGAAILASVHQVPEAAGVVTIGAPFEPTHVMKQFAGSVPAILENGFAEVELAGRKFCLHRSFIEDLQEHHLGHRLAQLAAPLLVLHSPTDTIVGIKNATEIFRHAQHPKSFIALDGVDHLLSRADDVDYTASLITAWFSRYY